MKLSRSILKEHNTPYPITLSSHKCLNRIKLRLQIELPRWHHPSNRTKNGNIRTQKSHLSDLAHIRSRNMIGKYLLKRRTDFRSPYKLAPIKSDALTILNKQSSKIICATLIPAIQ